MRGITRHEVDVGGRPVHYRRAGEGPPVVMLHESPRSSLALARLASDLADRCTAIALDTPGYGGSAPLDLPQPEIADFADALVATLDALGLDRVGLYGAHTGAQIVLETAARHPGRIAVAIMDGLPVFTAEEQEEFLARYLPELVPQPDGSHLVWAWNRFRDQHVFWPWYRREQAARMPARVPSARFLHEGALDILRSGDYRIAYAAAFRYDPLPALAALRVPASIVARGGDALADHLPRLPGLPACCASERLPGPRDGFVAGILRHLEPALGLPAAPPPPSAGSVVGGIERRTVSTAGGQLLVRSAGPDGGRPVVLLPGTPGGALPLEPLVAALAPARRALALDLPGHGDSDPLPAAEPALADYARAIAEALDRLVVRELDLYGTGTGAAIAVETALHLGARVQGLVLDGLALPDDDARDDLLAHGFPDLAPRWDGTHLLTAWQLVRDSCLWSPWYDRRPERALSLPFYEDPALLHGLVVELLRGCETFARADGAVLAAPLRERLGLLRGRERLVAAARAGDPARASLGEVAELAGATPVVLAASLGALVDLLADA
ncbi:MAG: alpha/beta fold hydrolase [Thermoleophilia bacterium]